MLPKHKLSAILRRFSTRNVAPVATPEVRVDAAASTPPGLTARRVYIYQPARNAMQSGLLHTSSWRLDFDNEQSRWENPLMGWTSSRDAMQGVSLNFDSEADAVRFAERQGWQYAVRSGEETHWRQKSYSGNFSYSPAPLKLIRTK